MAAAEASRMKILLVDDDVPNLELYQLAFTMRGHEVSIATSGAEGIEAFKSERPDAVICDLILGDMVGTEVIERMRAEAPSNFYLLSEAEPVVVNSAAARVGIPCFQKLGVPVGEVVKRVTEDFAARVA